jgi:poly-gamma-glutamate synthesis protein (capsule biosynthesis protein)
MKRWIVLLGAAALALFLLPGVALAAIPVESVTLPVGVNSVDVGAKLTLDAIVTPADAGVTVSWYSSRPQYATVKRLDADTCVITGRAMGRTKITAKAGGRSYTRMFYVRKPMASSIKLNTRAKTLNPSGTYSTYTLRATTTPTYHSDSITWSTDDPSNSIIAIEPSPAGDTCKVTAVSDGSEAKTCTVTATLDKAKKSAACVVTITKIPEKYVRLITSAVVPLGSSRPLTATVYPTDAFDRSVTWSVVKNPDVVALQDNGNGTVTVNGKLKGTAVIRASASNGRYADCTVTVKSVRYASFSVSPSSKTIRKGASYSYQLKTKVSPTYVSYPDILVTSGSPTVAEVTKVDGVWTVTGVGRGYAKINVSADNGRVTRTLSVRVLDYEKPVTVSLSAIGDVMLGGDPRKSSFSRFETLWKNGADYFFSRIKGKLDDTDIAVANLEVPLINTSRVVNSSRSYVFRGKTTYASALAAGGIDAVDLDNNHIMDYGSSGLSSTKSAVKAQGVGYFGLGSVSYITENGVKVGFAGFRPENISLTKLKATVKSLKQRCDILVVSFHWGVEYRYSPTGQQITYGRTAVQAGADLVLGHHSHVVSGVELYRGKHIVYGLGTIVSTVALPDDIDCIIYQHTFSVLGTTVSNAGFNIVPVKMTDNTSYNDAQPYVATGDAATKIIDKVKRYSTSGADPF